MKLIKPSFEIIEQQAGLLGIYKQIERAGRICYKSEDKITDDSAEAFVQKMVDSKHYAMLEHGTVYLMIYTIAPEDWDKKIARHPRITTDDARNYLRTNPTCDSKGEENWWAKEARHIALKMAVKYADNPYSKVEIVNAKHEVNTEGRVIITPTGEMPIVTKGSGKIISVFNTILITTNLRVLVENNWLDDLKYICEPTEHHEKRHSVKFIADAGVMREFFRHRAFSMAQESTRYCNYSNNKFGKELTFIAPPWIDVDKYNFEYGVPFGELPVMRPRVDDTWGMEHYTFFYGLQHCEEYYFKLLELGWKPQQARAILPLALKAEGIMTGFASDWQHFFNLRAIGTTGAPHPQAKELAEPLMNEFIKRKYI